MAWNPSKFDASMLVVGKEEDLLFLLMVELGPTTVFPSSTLSLNFGEAETDLCNMFRIDQVSSAMKLVTPRCVSGARLKDLKVGT